MKDENKHSSFAVAVSPEFTDSGEWTGSITAVLEEDIQPDLDADELLQIRSVCGMMAACLPLMEEDKEFFDLVKNYFNDNYTQLVDELLEEQEDMKRPNFTRSRDGKVITLDFGTKTFGSA